MENTGMSPKKKVIFLLVWAIVSITGYLLLYMLYDVYVLMAYLIVAGICIVTFTVLNRGFDKVKLAPDAPAKEIKRHNAAQITLIIALPLMTLPLIDYLLMQFDYTLVSVLMSIV